MSCYFDTSALVKIYHRENGTDVVLPIYESDEVIAVSELSRLEFVSTILRKYREHAITVEAFNALLAKFQEDLAERFSILRLSSLIIDEAEEILKRFGTTQGIRTLDSLQLAFFTTYSNSSDQFVCSDLLLCEIVHAAGYRHLNPEKL